MKSEPQTLDAVLDEARKNRDNLTAAFDVPVLLVVGEDPNTEGQTAVTAPGAPKPRPPSNPPGKAPASTWVVPVQSRTPKLATPRLSFGRSTICDVVLPFSPVSKHHGYFEKTAAGWVALDVGSTNGTVVDGKIATQANPVQLHDGAAVQLGKLSARFFTAAGFVQVLKQRLSIS
jgi:pSer/pThr/pTyr-binding forkhead associated (FHA) protein